MGDLDDEDTWVTINPTVCVCEPYPGFGFMGPIVTAWVAGWIPLCNVSANTFAVPIPPEDIGEEPCNGEPILWCVICDGIDIVSPETCRQVCATPDGVREIAGNLCPNGWTKVPMNEVPDINPEDIPACPQEPLPDVSDSALPPSGGVRVVFCPSQGVVLYDAYRELVLHGQCVETIFGPDCYCTENSFPRYIDVELPALTTRTPPYGIPNFCAGGCKVDVLPPVWPTFAPWGRCSDARTVRLTYDPITDCSGSGIGPVCTWRGYLPPVNGDTVNTTRCEAVLTLTLGPYPVYIWQEREVFMEVVLELKYASSPCSTWAQNCGTHYWHTYIPFDPPVRVVSNDDYTSGPYEGMPDVSEGFTWNPENPQRINCLQALNNKTLSTYIVRWPGPPASEPPEYPITLADNAACIAEDADEVRISPV